MRSIITKFAAALAGLLALVAVSAPARASEVLTFDSFGPYAQDVGSYGGLQFDNFTTLAPSAYPWMSTTGYAKGVVSGSNMAFNWWGAPATISDPGHFTLVSAFFTSAWIDGLKVKVEGMDDGVVKFVRTLTLNTHHTKKVYFDWAGVTKVKFTSYFEGCSDAGRQFVMDNLKVIPCVPEPSTWLLMIAGFGGVGTMIRAQRRGATA